MSHRTLRERGPWQAWRRDDEQHRPRQKTVRGNNTIRCKRRIVSSTGAFALVELIGDKLKADDEGAEDQDDRLIECAEIRLRTSIDDLNDFSGAGRGPTETEIGAFEILSERLIATSVALRAALGNGTNLETIAS